MASPKPAAKAAPAPSEAIETAPVPVPVPVEAEAPREPQYRVLKHCTQGLEPDMIVGASAFCSPTLMFVGNEEMSARKQREAHIEATINRLVELGAITGA